MSSLSPIPQVAVIGPGMSWETPEAVSDFCEWVGAEGISTKVLDARGDPRLTALTAANVNRDHIGGLAVVNYSYSYEEELDLSADPAVQKAAQKAANLALPIFVSEQPTMGGLELEAREGREAELIIVRNSIEVITNKLLGEKVVAGAA